MVIMFLIICNLAFDFLICILYCKQFVHLNSTDYSKCVCNIVFRVNLLSTSFIFGSNYYHTFSQVNLQLCVKVLSKLTCRNVNNIKHYDCSIFFFLKGNKES